FVRAGYKQAAVVGPEVERRIKRAARAPRRMTCPRLRRRRRSRAPCLPVLAGRRAERRAGPGDRQGSGPIRIGHFSLLTLRGRWPVLPAAPEAQLWCCIVEKKGSATGPQAQCTHWLGKL